MINKNNVNALSSQENFTQGKKFKITERSIDLKHPQGEKKVFLYVVVG